MHPDLLPHATALRAVRNLVRHAHLHDESTVQRLVERAVAAKGATVFGRGSAMSSDAPRTRWSFLDWWRQAETAAEIPRTPGLGFHSLRRAFATELKGTPLPDLQYMGEWKSAATLLTCCMHPDEHTMRAALANRRAVPAPPPARDVVTAVTADGLEIGAENVSARRAIDSTNRQQRAATR